MSRYLACSKRSDSGERFEEQGNGAENSMQKKKKKTREKWTELLSERLGRATRYMVSEYLIYNESAEEGLN